jgi:hypothetical protein
MSDHTEEEYHTDEEIAEILKIDEKLMNNYNKKINIDEADDKERAIASRNMSIEHDKKMIIEAVKNIPQITDEWIEWYNKEYDDMNMINKRLEMLEELAKDLLTHINNLSEFPGLTIFDFPEYSEGVKEVLEEYPHDKEAQDILEMYKTRNKEGGKISKRKVRKSNRMQRKSKRKQHKPRKSKRRSCKSTKKRNTKKH